MLRFLLRRTFEAAAVLVGISMLVFIILRLSGDPAALLLPSDATSADYAELRHAMGLDRGMLFQYWVFISRAVHGDFGESIRGFVPAMDLVLSRLPATILLTFASLAVALAIAFPVGLLAGLRKDSLIDRALMAFSVMGQGMPVFWLGLLLILVFSVHLHLLPTSGYGRFQNVILPALTLGFYTSARLARLVRSGVVETASADFVRTGIANGLPRRQIVFRYILRNALLPIVTVVALDFATLLGGAVIVETIFGWPGVGRLTVESITRRDFPVVQASVILLASFYVVINFVLDLAYLIIDPRIRLQ